MDFLLRLSPLSFWFQVMVYFGCQGQQRFGRHHRLKSGHSYALNLFVGLLFDFFVVGCIKSAVQRKRPQYNTGCTFTVVTMHGSVVPSTHSSLAVMIVSLIYLYTPMWLAMISQYGWPNLVLKYEKNHFSQSVFCLYVENDLTIAQFVLMLCMVTGHNLFSSVSS